jgi:hypothetical protein
VYIGFSYSPRILAIRMIAIKKSTPAVKNRPALPFSRVRSTTIKPSAFLTVFFTFTHPASLKKSPPARQWAC